MVHAESNETGYGRELRESRQFGMTHPVGGRLTPWGKSLRRNYSLAHIRFCILYE